MMEELIEQVLDVLRNSEDALDVIESLDVAAVIGRLPNGVTKHNDDVLQHLLELSSTLDKYSAGKDYIESRKAHYKNIEWLHNHGLTDMYYDVLFGQIKAEKEAEKDK
jgi:hypothetical protein